MNNGRMHSTDSGPGLESQRQFGLAGLLSFFVGCSAYLAMLCSLAELLKMGHPDHRVWPLMAAVPVTWIVLALLYRRWNLPELGQIHRLGIKIAGAISFLIVFIGGLVWVVAVLNDTPYSSMRPREAAAAITVALMILWFGAATSAAISFPTAILVFLRVGLRGPLPAGERRANFSSPTGTN